MVVFSLNYTLIPNFCLIPSHQVPKSQSLHQPKPQTENLFKTPTEILIESPNQNPNQNLNRNPKPNPNQNPNEKTSHEEKINQEEEIQEAQKRKGVPSSVELFVAPEKKSTRSSLSRAPLNFVISELRSSRER